MKFLIDENLPKSLAEKLKTNGYDTLDLRNIDKVGISDEDVGKIASNENRIIITANYKHFANIMLFPPKNFPGIITIRMSHCSIGVMVEHLIKAISSIKESDITRSLIIIEPHRIRKRK